jgi:hypothetical protein
MVEAEWAAAEDGLGLFDGLAAIPGAVDDDALGVGVAGVRMPPLDGRAAGAAGAHEEVGALVVQGVDVQHGVAPSVSCGWVFSATSLICFMPCTQGTTVGMASQVRPAASM